jgi:hypothetical protein
MYITAKALRNGLHDLVLQQTGKSVAALLWRPQLNAGRLGGRGDRSNYPGHAAKVR